MELQTRKSQETVIGRAQCCSVLNRERSQMGIRREVPGHAKRQQQVSELLKMIGARMNQSGAGLIQPCGNQLEGGQHR